MVEKEPIELKQGNWEGESDDGGRDWMVAPVSPSGRELNLDSAL